MTEARLFDVGGLWTVTSRSDPVVNALADRHYSRRRPGAGRVAGPGRALVLLSVDGQAVWVTTWPKHNADGFDFWRCSIFRNEGPELSSTLILGAMDLTARLWSGRPRDGWGTWVDTRRVRSSNPGFCFLAAGWWKDKSYVPGYRQRWLIRLRADA